MKRYAGFWRYFPMKCHELRPSLIISFEKVNLMCSTTTYDNSKLVVLN